ncbi:hypothetical protein [Klenkia taihuensis]|uniref:Uncharacterized protein n=1 Tax=Klenkia taihuensis TaxID=1225127 RepID=A0A1I1SFB5_9ACTN|nr:hypothetical protein [Klenkia taihuensis]GHE13457.1 hypothetical protein GCM10011381_35800 [Klenkia taihuensis]SFD45174.1 hypothetical protein SAMN05661030_3389 [Klenkia taihuensis]
MNPFRRLVQRFGRPPAEVAAAAGDEDVLAWGARAGGGWLVAGSAGLRAVPDGELLPWHLVGHARWTAAGQGGSFAVTPLVEVEPGVQTRGPVTRYLLDDAGELPAVVRRRVDQTVVASTRHPLPAGGGVLLVARRVPGQAAREWSVVFDDDADRDDPAAREVARARLAEAVDGEDASR